MFYVYEHWRPDRDEPFYVGKGRGGRANLMARRNAHHRAIQMKLHRLGLAVEVRIVAANLTEDEAFLLEIERIKMWRESGIDLSNQTIGGEGPAGKKLSEWQKKKLLEGRLKKGYGPMSFEQKEKLSKAMKGKKIRLGAKLSDETRAKISTSKKGKPSKLKGKPKSQDVKDKISASLSAAIKGEKNPFWGRKHSEETKQKISEAKSGEKHSFFNKKHTEETKRKMREAWVRRKENAA
jgi:hypothetical protein